MSEPENSEKQGVYDFKVKIAGLITGINALLTIVKFVLYYFSGSMAILAEAWHSFADIATSLFVFIALLQAKPCDNASHTESNLKKFRKHAELFISLVIGLFLAAIACMLMIKFFTAEPRTIEYPLVSGLIFLGFSFVSYFIYRFETRIGEREHSIGLVSDGMHARADMVASLITGFALVLYTMNLDLDRWVAGVIALFVLSFAVETIVNVVLLFFRGEEDSFQRVRSSRIVTILFDKQAFQEKTKSVQSFFEKRFRSAGILKIVQKTFLVLLGVGIPGVFLCSMVFTVQVHEKAVIERFGRPVKPGAPIGPGLHFKWPWPVDRVMKAEALYIEQMNIGNIFDRQSNALLWTERHGDKEEFLSGDNNFFYPYIVLHYSIKDISRFLYKNADPGSVVRETAHRIATHLFARHTFYDIASTDRSKFEKEMFARLQQSLDELETGVELMSVNFKDIHPPISVAAAFEKVIAGYQEKQKVIYDALGYQYGVVPDARGNAARETEAARAYIEDQVKKAEGGSRNFVLSLPGTEKEKDVTMARIHLETLRAALKDKTKIIIDPKVGMPDIWMNFEGLVQKDEEGVVADEIFSDY